MRNVRVMIHSFSRCWWGIEGEETRKLMVVVWKEEGGGEGVIRVALYRVEGVTREGNGDGFDDRRTKKTVGRECEMVVVVVVVVDVVEVRVSVPVEAVVRVSGGRGGCNK